MITNEKKVVLDLFSQGRELYKSRNFDMAFKKFSEALSLDKDDGPSKVYYERCRMYIDNPPSSDWDGVFDMKTK